MSMKSVSSFRFSTGVLGYPILFVLIIWIVFWAELRFGFQLKYLDLPSKNRRIDWCSFQSFYTWFINTSVSQQYSTIYSIHGFILFL